MRRSTVDFPVPGGPSSNTWRSAANAATNSSSSRRRLTTSESRRSTSARSTFIAGERYGTRSSTIVLVDADDAQVRVRETCGAGAVSKVVAVLDDGREALIWQGRESAGEGIVEPLVAAGPGRVALEVEWNNKDPFFDRDLNNFRLLFDLRAVSVGVIITRTDSLQEIFDGLGRGSSYGSSTTHMSKLLPRINGGSGGGCPILVLGISKELYVEDSE